MSPFTLSFLSPFQNLTLSISDLYRQIQNSPILTNSEWWAYKLHTHTTTTKPQQVVCMCMWILIFIYNDTGSLCLLIRALSPYLFKVIIERCIECFHFIVHFCFVWFWVTFCVSVIIASFIFFLRLHGSAYSFLLFEVS